MFWNLPLEERSLGPFYRNQASDEHDEEQKEGFHGLYLPRRRLLLGGRRGPRGFPWGRHHGPTIPGLVKAARRLVLPRVCPSRRRLSAGRCPSLRRLLRRPRLWRRPPPAVRLQKDRGVRRFRRLDVDRFLNRGRAVLFACVHTCFFFLTP